MTAAMPNVDWRWAERTGHRLVRVGPEASDDEKRELVADLRECARRAPALVAAAAGLERTGTADERVVDRLGWISANVDIARTVMRRLDAQEPDGAGERAAAKVVGAQLGAAFAFLGTRILGQYDPFSEAPSLMLVAPNVMHVERQLHLVPHDFRMWVCLHEQTHRVQFATAPWLADHVLDLARQAIDAEEESGDTSAAMVGRIIDHARGRGTNSLLEAVSAPAAQRALGQVTAVMSLLEGHADVMMDRAGPSEIATLGVIRARFDKRRARGGLSATFGKLMGMDVKLAQYRDGAAFCRHVIDRIGVEGLNLAFERPGHLPGVEELHDPQAWVDRMG